VLGRLLALSSALVVACASSEPPPGARPDPGTGPGSASSGSQVIDVQPGSSGGSSDSGVVVPGCKSGCTDLPSSPIFDDQGPSPVPGDAPSRFGAADDFDVAGGPCVVEPELSTASRPGALFPANWLRPRFRFRPVNGEDLFEIRITASTEASALVAYTTSTTWTMPRDLWKSLAANAVDEAITVTIRATHSGAQGRPTGTRGSFRIAPVLAGGTMIYWAATSSDVTPTTSKLVGFRVGDEGRVDALTIPEVAQSGLIAEGGRDLRGQYGDAKGVPPGHVECIGCHVTTPDGNAVAFTDHWPWNVVVSSVEAASPGAVPPFLTDGAARLIDQPWLGMATFSKAHWSPGDRILVTSYSHRSVNDTDSVGFSDGHDTNADRLAWFDLDAPAAIPWQSGQPDQTNAAIEASLGTAWGLLELGGESRAALTPSFSHDGTRIAYTSATTSQDGRIGDDSETDIRIAPFGERHGGAVGSLEGASTPGVSEYYPAFSADDQLIAFNRAAGTQGKIYYRPDGEIDVVPASGGVPTRLSANDPPECTGETSPGVINSWAKWSPAVIGTNGKHYYFLIFSSARAYEGSFELPRNQYSPSDTRASQLYMAGIVRDDATGALTTYGAVYLWNQDATTTNLTPAWDQANIPEVALQ